MRDAIIVKGLSSEQKALLTQLQSYDFSHVARKCAEEYSHLDEAELRLSGVEQLRRYYALRVIYGPADKIGVPVRLDPMAHVHVLFSREYRKFCSYFFDQFFEHWPCDRSDHEHMEWLGDVYRRTLVRFDETFGDRDRSWWPDLEGPNLTEKTCCGCSCAGQ